MNGLDLLEKELWDVSWLVGYDHAFFTLNKAVIIHTWIMLGLLLCVLIPIRWLITTKKNIASFMAIEFVRFFVDMTTQAFGTFHFVHFSFIASIFIFIACCNTLSLFPWLEEPTADLNTTIALGCIAFLYTQITAIKVHGLIGYCKGYFVPFFVMFPLNIIGKLSSVISISFRLFGNIFGGAIISSLYFSALRNSVLFEALGIASGLNLMIMVFFSLFEGFLQAFVFSMLTLTYLSIAIQGEGN